MGDREPPYDPYIPTGGAGGAAGGNSAQNGNQRTAALQAVSGLQSSPKQTDACWLSSGSTAVSLLNNRHDLFYDCENDKK